jgi:hypothetical protein
VALYDQVFKRLFAFMTPLFAVSDSPPTYASGEARPGRANLTTGGIEVHVVGNTDAETAAPLGAWVEHAPVDVPAAPTAALQLPNVACKELMFVGDENNSGRVYVGSALVASNKSVGLIADEVWSVRRISNANEFYTVAATGVTGQKLRFMTR